MLKVVGLPILKLGTHMRSWDHCTKCEIGRFATKHVFYRGTLPTPLLFIGLAPGRTENAVGWPFVGRSGKLLERWLEAAFLEMEMPPSFAIANLVACRPCNKPGAPNRDPSLQEIRNCRPRLVEFIREFARPKVLVTLGKISAEFIPAWQGPRLEMRHPSWALRNGAEADVKLEKLENPVSIAEVVKLVDFLRRNLHATV